MTQPSWRELRADVEDRLRRAGVEGADRDARWMVERVSGYAAPEMVTGEGEPATQPAIEHVGDMIERRIAGEPLQYVLGEWQFLGLDLLVDRRVLVPRPETEVVAQVAIAEAQRLGARRGAPDAWAGADAGFLAADLGTGSGALALAMVTELPEAIVWATDASEDALAVARANLAGTGVAATRVRLANGHWFDALPGDVLGALRVIVSNPPYVAESEVPDLPAEVVDWEPRDALVSGPTGMEAIEVILDGAPQWLDASGASLVLELAPHQAGAARALAREAGFADIDVHVDLTGRDRVLVARLPG